MKYRLWYIVIDGGDGSAFPEFFTTEKYAQEAENKEIERHGHAWAEPSIGWIDIEVGLEVGDYPALDIMERNPATDETNRESLHYYFPDKK